MRIGLLGPADGNAGLLREASEFLIGDAGVDQAIYLGNDDSIDRMVTSWARDIMNGEPTEDQFLASAVEAATDGSAADIERLLVADVAARRLSTIRKLPPPPARAIEMIDDRIILCVHDKAVLDEEDIANANVIVYGRSTGPDLKRFGPRYFFTPGPVTNGKVGVLESEPDGRLVVALYELTGAPIWREPLDKRVMKLVVTP